MTPQEEIDKLFDEYRAAYERTQAIEKELKQKCYDLVALKPKFLIGRIYIRQVKRGYSLPFKIITERAKVTKMNVGFTAYSNRWEPNAGTACNHITTTYSGVNIKADGSEGSRSIEFHCADDWKLEEEARK